MYHHDLERMHICKHQINALKSDYFIDIQITLIQVPAFNIHIIITFITYLVSEMFFFLFTNHPRNI